MINSMTQLVQKFGFPPNTPFGTPESVASIVSYLAKPEAFFISGMATTWILREPLTYLLHSIQAKHCPSMGVCQ